jgi:hypothetical protein
VARRDEFSRATQLKLERRAGGVCSICLATTTGANADGSGEITVGTAAHICAAALGGPRYDPRMSPEERSSADNGIWLCRNHGDAIDDDETYYTVERLRRLKHEAEQASWHRVLNALPPPDRRREADDLALQEAAKTDLEVLGRTQRWPHSSVALRLRVAGLDEPASALDLGIAAQALDDLIMLAPPGMGKTTALLQIAEGLVASNRAVPIFVPLADWAAGGGPLLPWILERAAWRDVTEEGLRKAAADRRLVLLLDGWNELEAGARTKARIQLEQLKAELPDLVLLLSSRREAVDFPFEGAEISLLPLDERQQLEIAVALRGDEGASLLDRAWRTTHVRDLVAIPLYLTALMKLPPGTGFPATREEVLRRFVEAHEKDAGRATTLRSGLGEFAHDYLSALAVHASLRGTTSVPDRDARSIVSIAASDLVADGQMVGAPEPDRVLNTLIDAHVLLRDETSRSLSFQHQQFEEWFASQAVERQFAKASLDDAERSVLEARFLDCPAFEEAVLFAVERASQEDGPAKDAAAAAIFAAFDVDPLLASSMIQRGGEAIWAKVAGPISAKVRAWHNIGRCDRAVRFMLESGRPEFMDRLWPLITDANEQVALRALRNCDRLHVSLFGDRPQETICDLPPAVRNVLLHEIAYNSGYDGLDLAVDIARSDPEFETRRTVADALMFRSALRHLSRLLEASDDRLIDYVAVRLDSYVDIPDPATAARLAAASRRLREGQHDPLRQLGLLLRQAHDPGLGPRVTELVAELDFHGGTEQGGHVLHQLAELYPVPLALGLIEQLRRKKALFYGAADYLAGSGLQLDDAVLLDAVLSSKDHDVTADGAATVLGPRAATKLFDVLVPLDERVRDRCRAYDKPISERYHTLLTRLARAPSASLVRLAQERTGSAHPHHLILLAQILARHFRLEDSRIIQKIDRQAQEDAQALALRWAEDLLLNPAVTRHQIAEFAELMSVIPSAQFLDVLSRMLDANLEELERFRREAEAEGWQGPARNEASWPQTHHYYRAFVAIDAPETRTLMHRYLSEPQFAVEAAQVLSTQWVRANESPPERWFAWNQQFEHLARRRAQRRSHPGLSHPDADAIFAQVEHLLAEGRSAADAHRAVELACHGARLPHGDRHQELIARLIRLAGRRIRPKLLTALIQSGEDVQMGLLAAGISETLEAAKAEPWILHDSDSYQLTQWFALLPFASDLQGLADVLQIVPKQHRRPEKLRPMLEGLGRTPSEGAANALFELAELELALLESHEWYDAVRSQRSEDTTLKLVALTADERTSGRRSPLGDWKWVNDLAAMIREFPRVRANIYKRLENALPTKGNVQLARSVAEALDEDGLFLLLDLSQSWDRDLISERDLQALITQQVPAPDWANAYNILPVDAASLRRRLLSQTSDGSRTDRAAAILNLIDEIRDEYGRLSHEPRHPDLASGLPWPIIPDAGPTGSQE